MKKLKVFLIVLLVLAIAGTALYFWQRENIKSVYYSTKYDDEKLDELIVEHNQEVETYLKEQTSLNVRPSTPAEEKLHQAGVITDDELIKILTGKTDLKTLLGTEVTLDKNKNLVDESGTAVSVEKLKEYKQERQSEATASVGGETAAENGTAISDDESESKSDNKKPDDAKNNNKKSDDAKSNNKKADNKKNNDKKSDSKKTGNEATGSKSDEPKKQSDVKQENGSEKHTNTETGSKQTEESGKNVVAGNPEVSNGQSTVANTGSNTAGSVQNTTGGGNTGSQSSDNGVSADSEKDPSECIAELYALKSAYTAGVEGIVNSAINSYSQMTANGGELDKSELLNYYNSAVSLEQQCDAAVNQIVGQLTDALEASGGDTAIVDKILDAYANEKSLKKAQYINKIK